MLKPEMLYNAENALAPHYTRFRVAERLLLTGHSHQAWPDAGFEGQQQAWLDAADLVDGKWDRAFEKAERIRRGYARLLDDADGHIALGQNTHELVVRWLSALPLRERPRLVTTDGEFHSIRRQLDRLAEEPLEIVKVPALPADGLAERLIAAVDDRTAAVMVSCVLFQTAIIVPNLGDVLAACKRVGAELLVDAYHALNAVPYSIQREGLEDAFFVGGGYKYMQLGEGNCFLRFPKDCAMRPVITGWYAEFDALADRKGRDVLYGRGAGRFAGSTYDPTSHYRAAAVMDFFDGQGLTPEFLREVSQHQVGLLRALFDDLDLDPSALTRDHDLPLEHVGGFLTLESARAGEISAALDDADVRTDFRGSLLRLGPAPYLSDDQLHEAMSRLGEVARRL